MGRRSNARDRLLTAASDLFRDRGFSAVSVAELCATANVNKGSFYYFFPSKRDLLLQIIDRAWDETGLLASWEIAIPEHPVAHLRQYLEELFAYHYADRENSGRVRGSFLANLALELSTHDRTVADRLEELLRREINAFAALLAEAKRLGEISTGNPNRSAEALVGCLHGLLMMAKIRNNLSLLPNNEKELIRLAGLV